MPLNLLILDDSDLLELVAARHSDALSVLYDRYSRLVFTVAVHIVGERETAEEITQDVFVRVWEGAGTYRVELAKVSSWIVRITRNRAIDELRRRASRPHFAEADFFEMSAVDQLGYDSSGWVDDPKETAELKVRSQHVRRIINSLPEEQKQVLGLAYFKGYSQSEIAELTGEPLGTVKSRLRLAMQKLRSLFAEQNEVDHPAD